jgi:RNA polymerase sigma-70 factor (ECF subfamily)
LHARPTENHYDLTVDLFRHVARRLLARVEADFSPTTWQAFRRVMSGEKAAGVAGDLKISVNAVYLAKSSVLRRLRQEMASWAG